MNLRELMQDDGMPPIGVDGLTLDSRVVQTGDLFVGLADDADTRSKHVTEAFSKGAVAAMVVGPVEEATALPIVVAHDLRDRLGDMLIVFLESHRHRLSCSRSQEPMARAR